MNSTLTTRAISESLRSLDEIRYALDQAAIVAATDHRGLITYANDKFCEISQYSRDELIGHDHRIINSGYRKSSCRSCGARSRAAMCGEARSGTEPRTGRSTGSIRQSCLSSTARESRASIWRFATTLPPAR